MRLLWGNNYYVLEGVGYHERMLPQSVPGAKWDKNKKVWLLPKISYGRLKKRGVPVAQGDRDKIEKEYKAIMDSIEESNMAKKSFLKGDMRTQTGFLMKHQELGLQISRVRDKYCFFYDTGTGKTIMALAIIDDKLKSGEASKWCVVCPIVLVLNAWMEDAKHFPDLKILPLTTNIKKEQYAELCEKYGVKFSKFDRKDTLIAKLKEVCNIYIINPESFHKFNEAVDGLVFDESVLLKNPTAKITKQITDFSKNLKYVYLLSGEPAPNTEEEYFSQMSIVEPGAFGTFITRFREEYFYSLDPMGYRRKLRPERTQEFFDNINKFATFVTKEQCLDLPEHTTRTYKFDLSDKMYKHYKMLEKTALLEMKDMKDKDINVQADFLLTKMMKLRQMAGGFIMNDGEVQFIHNEKLDTLQALLEQIGNKQVIIWISFHPEVEMISSLLDKMGKSYVTAYGLTGDKDESIQKFIRGEADIIIAHPKTLKYGVTLTNCAYSIKYSMGHSYDDFKQSQDRIHRKGKTVPTTEYLLTARGTIEELIIKAVTQKRDKTDLVKDVLQSLAVEHGDNPF